MDHIPHLDVTVSLPEPLPERLEAVRRARGYQTINEVIVDILDDAVDVWLEKEEDAS